MLRLGRVTLDRTLDEHGNNKHIDRMVALRHWAQPLELDESRLTVHVLEAVDPAGAILEFTRVNHVDHIVIGARREFDAARAARQRFGKGRRRSRLHRDGGATAAVGALRRCGKVASAGQALACAQSRVWTGGSLVAERGGFGTGWLVTRPFRSA